MAAKVDAKPARAIKLGGIAPPVATVGRAHAKTKTSDEYIYVRVFVSSMGQPVTSLAMYLTRPSLVRQVTSLASQ